MRIAPACPSFNEAGRDCARLPRGSRGGQGLRIEQTLARLSVYRWFSRALVQPEALEELHQALREALDVLEVDGARAVLTISMEQLSLEFPWLFSHNLTPDCSPYETQYGSAHIFWQSQQLADIAGFYRAFGLALSQAAHERLDHIAVELEFMGYLALKEAYAVERHHDPHRAVAQDAQRNFLKDHLGRWAGTFSRRIQAKRPGSAYASLAKTLDQIVAWDCRRLGIQPEPLLFNENAQRQEPIEEGCLPCGGPEGQRRA